MMEKIMAWSDQADGVKWVALRYFNVAGAARRWYNWRRSRA
jgi:UDP-glucose 4-epimerase